MTARELNFDGIVGPTHNYAGLSYGNVASTGHRDRPSNPRAAALQGLAKMKLVADLGVPQAVLPPLPRPCLSLLRKLGFHGGDTALIDAAWKTDPRLLAACYSASNMWTANAATVSPSADCDDRRLHLTPANLCASLHRALEAEPTTDILRAVFADRDVFVVHDPLPPVWTLADEGAANHTRLCPQYGMAGIELFTYGRVAGDSSAPQPSRFPARQTRQASMAIARNHQLRTERTMFVQQLPAAIDAGVFHNDVISVGNQNVFLVHSQSFVDQPVVLHTLRKLFEKQFEQPLHLVEVSWNELSLGQAVRSYLFNSQLVTGPDGSMTLICPSECHQSPQANACLERIVAEANPIRAVKFLDLRQSMNNGGGPACLRLRVVLNQAQQQAVHPGVILNDQLFESLSGWIAEHYRDELKADDLRDPRLVDEVRAALSELAEILKLPPSLLSLDGGPPGRSPA